MVCARVAVASRKHWSTTRAHAVEDILREQRVLESKNMVDVAVKVETC